ncbi:PLP-dependent aminotransferase family protein [Clostridiaceae bacterium 35-E11]
MNVLTVDWKPDKQSELPLYKQIVEYIKGKIAKGDWPVGSQIPTQRILAQAFEVNRSTVVTALDELIAEGLLEGKGRRGTRIINNTWSLLASTPPPNWQSYIKAGIHRPNLPTIQEINRLEFESNIIRLGTGELSPELFPKDEMKEVLSYIPDRMESLGYEEPKGMMYLREQICIYLKKFGIYASPASILIVSGALQALQLIAIGLLQPGATVLLEKPSYLHSLHVFQSAGMRMMGVPLEDNGISIKEVAKYRKLKNPALLYTIPTFHNPTGIVVPEEKRHELLGVCEKEKLPIIEDDVYRELWIDAPPPQPLKALDQNGLVLYLGSMSKTLSPGLRIGWMVGPEPVIERLGDVKMQTDYGSSSLSQWAVAEWLSSGRYEQHLENVRKKLATRRAAASEALNKYFKDIATWKTPGGGFYIWLRFRTYLPMDKLFKKAWKSGILLNPGNVYDMDANQHLRISYSYASMKDLEYSLCRLAHIVRELMAEGA